MFIKETSGIANSLFYKWRDRNGKFYHRKNNLVQSLSEPIILSTTFGFMLVLHVLFLYVAHVNLFILIVAIPHRQIAKKNAS